MEQSYKGVKNKNFQTIDFCGVKLTARQQKFIVNYCTPGQPHFHNALQAALKAGYKEAIAKSRIYDFLQSPDIQKIIRANDRLIHRQIRESAMRALELKQRRAFYDLADYYEEREITLTHKNGDEYTKTVMALKDLKAMTAEERLCIDGIDLKGQAAIPLYIMPDRGKELDDLIKLDAEFSKSAANTDEEETRELIIERITIRETRRSRRDADMEDEIIDNPRMADREAGE